MPYYSGKDERRGSSPFDFNDERSDDHKRNSHRHGSDDKRLKSKEWNHDGKKYHHHHSRDFGENSRRNYKGRNNDDHYGRSRHHEFGRRHRYDRDRSKPYMRRSPSPSNDKSPGKDALQSSSPAHSKSKRASGFDMAPTLDASGQVSGVSMDPQVISGLFQNVFSQTNQATRHARRVYVGGLPPLANEQTISRFFSHVMTIIGGNSAGPGDAVINVYINHEKKFAFVEMRTVEEASNAMALDGIMFEGVSVRVRRPTDYNPSLASTLGPGQPSAHLNLAAAGLSPGMTGDTEGADRIFIGGIPYYFTEAQIKELLESFGPLRGFDLVKDRETGNSKGYGFCYYQDPSVTDVACAALSGLKVGDKTLTVRRGTMSGQLKPEQEYVLAQAQQHVAMQKMALEAGIINPQQLETVAAEMPTKILCLSEVISTDELMDDGEYEEILEDMKEEGQKFGVLIDVVIPRPTPDLADSRGVGKVFMEYSDTADCAKAKHALGGRKFGGNTVIAVYYPEEQYHDGDYGV